MYSWSQNKQKNWVFITFTDSEKAILGPLLKIWINLAIIGLFEKKDLKVPPLNIVVDELNSVGKIELLPAAIERARKYRGKVILGYQSESSLKNIYGHDAESIKVNTGNKFIFRCCDSNEAADLSKFLGSQEIVQPNLSTSYGVTHVSDRENIGEQEKLKNIVLGSEIQSLEDSEFYLKSLHMNPVKSRVTAIAQTNSRYNPSFDLPNPKVELKTEEDISSCEGAQLIF